MSTDSAADPDGKIPWPPTYLERLESVTAQLRRASGPATLEALVEQFSGVTPEQIEAVLTALMLFGRIEKKGRFFSIPGQR